MCKIIQPILPSPLIYPAFDKRVGLRDPDCSIGHKQLNQLFAMPPIGEKGVRAARETVPIPCILELQKSPRAFSYRRHALNLPSNRIDLLARPLGPCMTSFGRDAGTNVASTEDISHLHVKIIAFS